VTASLRAVADARSGELILDNRFKSLESLTRKLTMLIDENSFTAEEASARVNDALRYTLVFAHERLTPETERTLEMLTSEEYQVDAIQNSWVEGNSYKGINATLVSPSGQPFELQFHTPESFRVARATHGDYEIKRDLSRSLAERQSAHDRLVEVSATLEHPPGVETIGRLKFYRRPA
jgi:hypothetical protein